MKRIVCPLVFAAVWAMSFFVQADDVVPTGTATKIWDQAPHNAFTDLVRFNDRWFCVFREGQGHVSPDGALRVITSIDGEKWESAALITSSNSDLRDAKITVTPDGQLMLCGAEALHDKSKHTHQSLAWFSMDGRIWSEKHAIGDPDFWLWRVTWHKGTAYGIGYGCGKEKSVRLYSSRDGRKFETLVERLHDVGYPNETSIVFEGDTAYCLLRRDGQVNEPNTGLLGVSQAPFTQWEWKDLGTKIGGPHMISLTDGRYVAAVRLYDRKVRTSICWLDPKAGKLTEYLALPSGGDTSYAGLVVHEGQLWVSYYSSHEGKTSIYLSKMPLPSPVRDIGSRRELFLDKYLVEQLDNASFKLHEPRLAPPMTEPADNMEYGTVIKDSELFRLYTRDGRGAKFDGDSPEVTRYCESRDGIHWTKPKIGLFEIDGSKDNNVILHEAPFCHNFSPFLDQRPGAPAEQRFKALSIYATPFRRFTLRTDGFASVHVGADVGELVTRPLRFAGKELVINYSTSAGGSVRVEVQNESGQPIPGFSLADSRSLVGDAIEQRVSWTQGSDVSSLSGKSARLRFVMQEADLFAIQFRQ